MVRIIRVSHPRLRKIRTNLRKLIVTAVREERIALVHLKRSAYERIIQEEDVEALEDFRVFKREQKLLRDMMRASICQCASYTDMKKDLIYNSVDKKWYCERCYDLIKNDLTDFSLYSRA